MFFKSKPNVADGEKSRIEFHLQQVAEAIGGERCLRPIQSLTDLVGRDRSPEQIVEATGHSLNHDVSGVEVIVEPKVLEKCGGGG